MKIVIEEKKQVTSLRELEVNIGDVLFSRSWDKYILILDEKKFIQVDAVSDLHYQGVSLTDRISDMYKDLTIVPREEFDKNFDEVMVKIHEQIAAIPAKEGQAS